MCRQCRKPGKGFTDRYIVRPLKKMGRDLAVKPVMRALFGRRLPHAAPGILYIDTHVHTCFSHDSFADTEQVLINAARRGLDAIAITDHNEIRAVSYARQLIPRLKEQRLLPQHFLLIPGEEVSSADGHIGALFCEEFIPPGLPAGETIELIRQAGGLAVAVHPFGRSALKEKCRVFPFDAVELYNQSILIPGDVARTLAICRTPELARLPRLGASDGHNERDVGASYTAVAVTEVSLGGLREAIEAGRTVPQTCGLTRFLLALHRLSLASWRKSAFPSGSAASCPGAAAEDLKD
ncbi:MAG: PHP domain-containing protein [Armatimonadetes bacterium]|nr:PHP domain-containing protein [Armatimonadota bacterium]